MGNIISCLCCCKCCKCRVAKTLKKELKRDKKVEIIYKEITGKTECTSFPCDLEEAYI